MQFRGAHILVLTPARKFQEVCGRRFSLLDLHLGRELVRQASEEGREGIEEVTSLGQSDS